MSVCQPEVRLYVKIPLERSRRAYKELTMELGTNMTPQMKESLKRAEELLEAHELLSKIREDSLTKVKTDQDRLLESLESFDIVKERSTKTSSAAKRKKKAKREHWKTKDKRKREARRRAYIREKNKRKYEWKEMFKGEDLPKSWYAWLSRESTRMAHKKRKGWVITEEEFREHIFPSLLDGEGKPRIPVIQRYDKDGLWSLSNTYWTVDQTNVVFDGKEFLLRQLGYTL